MAVNSTCNDPADTYANIFYSRGNYLIFQTGTFPIENLNSELATVFLTGSVVAVVTGGPNGTTAYAGSGFDSYMQSFGGGNPWPDDMGGPPVGSVSDSGVRSCNPPPCPTGFHWDLDKGFCVADAPADGGGDGSGDNNPPPDPRPDWPNDTITVSINGAPSTIIVAEVGTEELKWIIRLWDLQHGITPPPVLKPPPGQPPPVIRPGKGKKCPAGYTYDPRIEMCVINPPPPPPVKPPIPPAKPPPVPPSQPDPDGDEITNDLCQQMQANTLALCSAINGMAGAGANDPACCTNLVNAIGGVTSALAIVAGAMPIPPSLAPVVGALDRIADALTAASSPAIAIDLKPLTDAIDRQTSAIADAPPTDTSGIVDQLKALNALLDIPESTFDLLVEKGFMRPATRALFAGDPFPDSWIKAIKSWAYDVAAGFAASFGYDLDSGKPFGGGPAQAFVDQFVDVLGQWATYTTKSSAPLLTQLIDQLKPLISPASTPAIGSAGVDPAKGVSFALGTSLSAAIAGYFAAAAGIDEGEPVTKIAELFGGAVSYEALKDVEIGPLIRHGIARVAEMNAKNLFQQELPGVGAITNYVARGLMPGAQAAALLGYNGLHFALQPIAQEAAYHGAPARALLRLIETGLFTEGDFVDELTFTGMRQASQARYLKAAPWIATNPQRNQLKATYENVYVNGLFSDADLSQKLQELNQNTDGDAMTIERVQLQKRIAFAKKLEHAYRQEFIAGLIQPAQYSSLLEGIGLQDDFINNTVAADMADVAAVQWKKQLADARALERATAAEERRAAVKNFTSGNTDEAGLLAALLLSGLNATQAAAWTDLASLQKSGGLRWTYGLQLPPAESDLLRRRVAALVDQRKSGLIQDQGLLGSLTALGISPDFANSIRAAANALLTPASSRVLLEVKTGS